MQCRFDLLQYWHDKICEDFDNDNITLEMFLKLDAFLFETKESSIRQLFIINLN